jgi:hypothetical protein
MTPLSSLNCSILQPSCNLEPTLRYVTSLGTLLFGTVVQFVMQEMQGES